MNRYAQVMTTYLLIVLSLLLPFHTYAEPLNLDQSKLAIKAYHDSGAYHKELTQVITKAKHYLIQRTYQNAKQKHPKQLAIVLDIDETSLSNYQKIAARDFAATKAQLHKEISQADSPAIEPMLSLYHCAQKLGVSVFFVTGRKLTERSFTVKNLLRAGYKSWNGLYLKPNDYHQASVIPFKSSARKNISEQGYTIIATIGDQQSDLAGGYAEKQYKLPNPFYYLP